MSDADSDHEQVSVVTYSSDEVALAPLNQRWWRQAECGVREQPWVLFPSTHTASPTVTGYTQETIMTSCIIHFAPVLFAPPRARSGALVLRKSAARDGRMFRGAVSLSLFCLLFSSLEGIGGSESYQQR